MLSNWRSGSGGSVSTRATPCSILLGVGIGPRRGRSDRWIVSGAGRRRFRNGASAPLRLPAIPLSRRRDCGKQFNERSAGSLNRTQYPSDVIALVVLWRLGHKLALRDLSE